MRTLAMESPERDETVPNSDERRYLARGCIKVRFLRDTDGSDYTDFLRTMFSRPNFDFMHSEEEETEIARLRKVVDETDQSMPWLDEPRANELKRGVRLVGSVVDYPFAPDFDASPGPPEGYGLWAKQVTLSFCVLSKCLRLRRGQLYAFEKHMAKLAEELARMRICNDTVSYEVKVASEGHFHVPQ